MLPLVRLSNQSPAVAQPGDGAPSLARPGQICTAASTLVALKRAPPSADIACSATSLAAMSAVASAKQACVVRGSGKDLRAKGFGSGWGPAIEVRVGMGSA